MRRSPAELNALKLPGVRFDTATRTIEAGYKFGGQTIPMIKVRVTDRNAVRPVELGVRMLRAIYARHPKEFQWRSRRSIGWPAQTSSAPPSNKTASTH